MFELRTESAVSKRSLMRTLYYVNAGSSWFGFYLDEGALALANDGARFNSFGAVLYGPASTISISLRNANRKDPARIATEMRRNGGRI